MNGVDLVVTGTLALADGVLPEAYVAIQGEKVVAIGERHRAPAASRRLDFAGALLLPGLVDAHVHALGSEHEGFLKTSTAAIAGGVTTIVDMPNDFAWPTATIDVRSTPEAVQRKVAMGEVQSLCDFALWGAATPESLPGIERMAGTGVVGFKIFMCDTHRMARLNDGELLEALQRIGRMGLVAAVHAENGDITRHLTASFRAEGKVAATCHGATRPDVAELEAVSRAVQLAEAADAQLHLLHITLPESVQMARQRDPDRAHVTVESCPQYLLLSQDTVAQLGALAVVQPPLRQAERAERMWEEVRAGRVDTAATDHSGQVLSTKTAPSVFDTRPGFPGVQTLLPLLYSEGVVKRGLSLERLVGITSTNPARRLGLFPRKGTLLPGSDADLVVLDPADRWRVAAAELRHGAGFTPYEGWELTGRPVATVSRGEVVYLKGEVLAKPGRARFIPAARAGLPKV